jgi:hypothetical protein
MARIDVRMFMAAPPERVWEVIADLERQGEWMVDVRRLEVVSDVKHGAGAVLHVTSELFGLPLVKDVMEITRWEPPCRMDVLHRGAFHGSGSFVLDPVENGTIFVWAEEFEPPLGPLGELGFRATVGPHLRRVFTRSLRNVRARAEAPARDGR